MRLSTGAINLSGEVLLPERSEVEEVVVLYSGRGTAWPPSAVLTVTSGDVVTIISRTEFSSEDSLARPGMREGCSILEFDVA